MQNNPPPVQISSTPEFQRKLRILAKKYRRISSDLQPVMVQLQSGEPIGDRIPRLGDYIVFKARVKNSDIQKGKSAGYRLIYWVESSTSIVLLDIYTKSEQADISATVIQEILAEYEQQSTEEE